jgi:hypothetical protein
VGVEQFFPQADDPQIVAARMAVGLARMAVGLVRQ